MNCRDCALYLKDEQYLRLQSSAFRNGYAVSFNLIMFLVDGFAMVTHREEVKNALNHAKFPMLC